MGLKKFRDKRKKKDKKKDPFDGFNLDTMLYSMDKFIREHPTLSISFKDEEFKNLFDREGE